MGREEHAQLGQAHLWLRALGLLAWGFVGISRLASTQLDFLPPWLAPWLLYGLAYSSWTSQSSRTGRCRSTR